MSLAGQVVIPSGQPLQIAVDADNGATANAVLGSSQNVAALGHACSPEASAWLPLYQTADLVTINGSATGAFVAPWVPRSSTARRYPSRTSGPGTPQ